MAYITTARLLGHPLSAHEKDISERKRAEEQLHAYARSLIEASLDPLVTISPESKITDVNEATIMVADVPCNILISTDLSGYFTEPDKASAGYQKAFSKGFVTDYPLALRHVSGKIIEVLYNANIYRNETGEVLGVFAAARDITECITFLAPQGSEHIIERAWTSYESGYAD